MVSKLLCCSSPVKNVPRAVVRAQNVRKNNYKLPYTSIGERHSMSVLESIGKRKTEIAKITNCDRKTVYRQLKKYHDINSLLDKQKSGRPTP
jgi:DNA invertase Pin-like site-specific DNA recombinase